MKDIEYCICSECIEKLQLNSEKYHSVGYMRCSICGMTHVYCRMVSQEDCILPTLRLVIKRRK